MISIKEKRMLNKMVLVKKAFLIIVILLTYRLLPYFPPFAFDWYFGFYFLIHLLANVRWLKWIKIVIIALDMINILFSVINFIGDTLYTSTIEPGEAILFLTNLFTICLFAVLRLSHCWG
jgi:hypothetical protein